MTKLEQKLIQLGYKQSPHTNRFIKVMNDIVFTIVTNYGDKIIEKYAVVCVESQQDIDNLQKAFNTLQSDLKEMELCQY